MKMLGLTLLIVLCSLLVINGAKSDIYDNVEARHSFDDNTTDLTGNGHDYDGAGEGLVTIVNNASCLADGCVFFDGNDCLEQTYGDHYTTDTTWSLAFWIKNLDLTADIQPLTWKEDRYQQLYFYPNDRYDFQMYDGDWTQLNTSDVTADQGAWVQILVVSDGATVKFWYNGTFIESGPHRTKNQNAVDSMGCDLENSRYYLTGFIDDYTYWSRTINASEIAAVNLSVYSDFTPPDTTAPTITVTFPSNTSHISAYNGTLSLYLDELGGNCSINNTDFYELSDNGTHWLFGIDTAPDGNYSLNISCWDDDNNNATITDFWFIRDTTNPATNLTTPANLSIQNANFNLDITYYDLYLWRTNTTIKGPGADYRNISSYTLSVGTFDSGNLSALTANDSVYYKAFEDNGQTPGLTMFINITDIGEVTGLDFEGIYEGNPAHNFYLYIWNRTGWEQLGQLTSGAWAIINATFTSDIYSTNGVAQLMLNHTSIGVAAHYVEIDYIRAHTNNIYFNNYSGNLTGGDEWYNLTDAINIANMANGRYNLTLDAADTHTQAYFNESLDYVRTGDDIKIKLSKTTDDFKLTVPSSIEFTMFKEPDRFTFQFCDDGAKPLKNTVLFIEHPDLFYLSDSPYSAHFIFNKYWFDLEPLAATVETTDTPGRYKLTFYSDKVCEVTNSLGGLNEISELNFFDIDATAPTFTGNATTSTTSSATLDFNASEPVNFTYLFGPNCTGATTGNNATYAQAHTITASGLSEGTTYYFNVTIYDNATNTALDCFSVTTTTTPNATGAGFSEIFNTSMCNLTFAENTTGDYLQGEICEGDDEMFIGIGIILLGVVFLLIMISDRLEFFYFTKKNGETVPIMRYGVLLVSGWLILALINIAIRFEVLGEMGLTSTVGVFYKAVLWTVIFSTAIWLIGFLFGVYQKITEMA